MPIRRFAARAAGVLAAAVGVGAVVAGVIWWQTPHADVVEVSAADVEAAREIQTPTLALAHVDVSPASLEEARALWEPGELAEAREVLEAALPGGEDEGVLNVLLAVVCRRQHDAEAAVEYGQRGAELCATSGAAHHVYSRAITERMRDGMLAMIRNAKPWREELRTAIELDPTNVDARTEELIFYAFVPSAMGGDRERAAELLAELEEYAPARAEGFRVRMVDQDDGLEAALARAAEALEEHPDAAELLELRGELHAKDDAFEAADADYAAAAELRPDDAAWRSLFQRAKLRLDAKRDVEQALAFLDEYAAGAPRGDYMPSPARQKVMRARALVQLGRVEEARSAHAQARALDDKVDSDGSVAAEIEAGVTEPGSPPHTWQDG